MEYAELLTMVRHESYTMVSIKNPWRSGHQLHTYILVDRRDSARAGQLPQGTLIYTPIQRSVVFSTAHCQLLYDLLAAKAITGVCDLKYINIPDVQRRASQPGSADAITDCGDGMLPMVERIIELRPQAMLISPFENSGGYGRLGKIGIPVVECADYMETSAMGRAEWMKFYGMLFGREREADSLFHLVDSNYQALKRLASQVPARRSILTERKTGSVWYVPGGHSSLGMLIADAHGAYAFADDHHSGSLPLTFETVLDKAGDTDVWAFKYNGTHPLSRADLLGEFHGYAGLKAFRTGEIYECNCSVKPFFEEVTFHPDYLLRELMILLHPELALGELRYYEKLH